MEAIALKMMDREFKIKYDEYGDVLYVITDQSRVATRTFFDDADIQWRYFGEAEWAAGFTVLDFCHVWTKREAELHSRIANHMGLSAQSASKMVVAIYNVSKDGAKTVEQALERMALR